MVILPYTRERTTPQDIAQITTHLARQDKDVRLAAFHHRSPPVVLADAVPGRTITVTLSNNGPTEIFEVLPGPKFFAPMRSKTNLLRDLQEAGIALPLSAPFDPDTPPDPDLFGPYTAIKTMRSGTSRGEGIHVFPTRRFSTLKDNLLKLYADDLRRGRPPMLQQYVPTGPNPCHTRVCTFLGAPLLCYQTVAPQPFRPETLSGIAGGEVTSNASAHRRRHLTSDEGMVHFAQNIARLYPQTSVLSIDMIRCSETGKLYCVEVNLGNLCVLSAPICSGLNAALGPDALHAQFGTYETIARRMIETLAESAPR